MRQAYRVGALTAETMRCQRSGVSRFLLPRTKFLKALPTNLRQAVSEVFTRGDDAGLWVDEDWFALDFADFASDERVVAVVIEPEFPIDADLELGLSMLLERDEPAGGSAVVFLGEVRCRNLHVPKGVRAWFLGGLEVSGRVQIDASTPEPEPFDPLTPLREIIEALPETFEKLSHGSPTWWGGKKTFATFHSGSYDEGDGRPAVWFKAPDGAQAALISADPTRFYRPKYYGPSGWVAMRLDPGVNWDEVRMLLIQGYRMVAPKRALAALDR